MEKNNDLSIIDLNKDVIIVIISKMHPNDIYSLILSNKRFATIVSYNIQYIQNMFLIDVINDSSLFYGKVTYKKFRHSGKMHGLYEGWYSNSVKSFMLTYNNGNYDGIFKTWYKNGIMHESYIFKMNKLDGLYEINKMNDKHTNNITYKITTNYKNNKKNGLFEFWSYSKKFKQLILIKKHFYKNNKINGLVERWYENHGTISERYNVINNIKSGSYTKWYVNSSYNIRCNYIDDKKHGLYEEFYQNGNKKKLVNYENGYKTGLCERWYKNGIIKDSVTYVNRKKCGLQEKWSEDGTKIFSKKYKNGILRKIEMYNI